MATAQGDIMIGSVKNMVDRLSKDFTAQKAPLTLPETKKNFNQFRHPQVVVTYAYKATQGDELSLNVGDTIEVLEEIEDGWGRGKNIKTGEVGAFPTNFVEAKSTPTTTVPPVLRPTVDEVTEPEASKRASSIVGFPRSSAFPEISVAKNKDSVKMEDTRKSANSTFIAHQHHNHEETPKLKEMARVKFVYEPQNPDELKLGEIGALIEIVRKDCGDPGWFEGELNGKVGLFPDNFVELVQVPAGSTSGSPKIATKVETKIKAPIQAPAPPAVPAKPKPKLSESNSSLNRIEPTTNNTTTTVPPQLPAAAKPVSSNFSDIRNKLAAGLPMFAPGDPAPAMSKSAMIIGSGDQETSVRPVSTSEISHETFEQPAAQLDHITKGRPRGPGKRPTSMAAIQKKSSMEYLLESPTTTTAAAAAEPHLEKTTEMASPSRFVAALKPMKEETAREEPKPVFPTVAGTTTSFSISHVRDEPIKIRTFQPTVPLKLSPVAAGDQHDQTPVSRKEYNDLLARLALVESRLATLENTTMR